MHLGLATIIGPSDIYILTLIIRLQSSCRQRTSIITSLTHRTFSNFAFYHFALLHLAVLHEQFHNYPDATWVLPFNTDVTLQAIREAINTARENKSESSLVFSLVWLHQFAKRASVRDKKEISVSREESLQYLKLKTTELNIPGLLSMVQLVEAQEILRNVILPVRVNLGGSAFLGF